MNKHGIAAILLFVLIFTCFLPLNAQWAKTYGGAGDDEAKCIQQTSDGGYIVAGLTESFGAQGKKLWVLKLNSAGQIEWQKSYDDVPSNSAIDHDVSSIVQMSDGGYVIAGQSNQVSLWILKLSSNGGIEWQKNWGGVEGVTYYLTSLALTKDGGFIALGYSHRYERSYQSGFMDMDIYKFTSNGNLQWRRYIGWWLLDWIGYYNKPMSIQQTSDGGYIVGGHSSYLGQWDEEYNYDYLILKLDSAGYVEWQKTYGGSDDEEFHSIQQTSDGGYIALGWTKSFGAGLTDSWILKLSVTGDIEWQRAYGGDRLDGAYSIQQIRGGGYIVVGPTTSFGAGRSDFFMMQLTSTGDVEWYRTCGGSEQDVALSIPQTIDGGFIVAGYTDSFGAGSTDFLIAKLNSQGEIHSSCSFVQSANPTVTITNITPRETDFYALGADQSFDSAIFSAYDAETIVNTICIAPTEFQLFLSTTAGGTTNPGPGTYTYEEGTSMVLSAIPDSGYLFNGWTGDVLFGLENSNPLNLVIDSVKHVTANFILPAYLTIELSIGGTTYPSSGVYRYKKGTTVALWAFSNTHYSFTSWTGNVPSGDENDNPISLTLDSNKTIKPNFLRDIYNPISFQGQKVLNRSLSQSEYINVLTWQANGDNADIVKYRIYSIGGKLLAEVDSSTLQYMDRKVGKDTYYTYICKAVNNEGREGNSAIVTVW